MHVEPPLLIAGPEPDRVRLAARVHYRDSDRDPETYWLEVPGDIAPDAVGSGNAWLAWLAPLAATLGEPLELEAPVDPTLLINVRELLRIWRAWYPELHTVSIDAPTDPTNLGTTRGTASFFSGGVDSFFTVLRHDREDGTPSSTPLDELLFIHGYDLPLAAVTGYHRVRHHLETAATALHKRLVPVATNLRETRFGQTDWEHLSHGAALAGVALALEHRYRRILIPSSAGYRDLRFWGSHPLTDPLFSTSETAIVHDGPAFMRAEKTTYVADFDVALRALRVCWKTENGTNCSSCNNCYRTMLTLEALGALERCPTFDRSALDLGQAARVFCPNTWDVRQFGYIEELATRTGRADIAAAVRRSLRRTARLQRRLRWLDALRQTPGLWRLVRPLRDRALAGWLT